MSLAKFVILTENTSLQTDEATAMLINLDHIISLKPIKITTTDRRLLQGYWLRLSNGKKYKALQVPNEIKELLSQEIDGMSFLADPMYGNMESPLPS